MNIMIYAIILSFFMTHAIKVINGIYKYEFNKDTKFFFINVVLILILKSVSIFTLIVYCLIIYFTFIYIYDIKERWRVSLSILLVYIFLLKSSIFVSLANLLFTGEYLDIRFMKVRSSVLILLAILVVFIIRTFLCNYLYRSNIKLYKTNIKGLKRIIKIDLVVYIMSFLLYFNAYIFILKNWEIVKSIKNISFFIITYLILYELGFFYILFLSNKYSLERLKFKKILKTASEDSLTGVLSRSSGLKYLKKCINRSNEYGKHLTICFIDINNLKFVNDNFGHAEGDTLIETVANLINSGLRINDKVMRLGGDEFLVIFDECKLERAKLIWSRIEKDIEHYNKVSDLKYNLSVSSGFSEYNKHLFTSMNEFIKCADEEMYRNKKIMKIKTRLKEH